MMTGRIAVGVSNQGLAEGEEAAGRGVVAAEGGAGEVQGRAAGEGQL